MGNRWSDEWEFDSQIYSPNQVEAIADYCNIEVVSETGTHFQAYCPFHNNTYDPAFVIDKYKGLWVCFNPSCAKSGNLEMLLQRLKGLNPFEVARTVSQFKDAAAMPLTERLEAIRGGSHELVPFPEEPVQRMRDDFWLSDHSIEYMRGRGFYDETLKYFDIGYSKKKDMVIVPMHDISGMLLGFVGRSVGDKIFKNSKNLPKRRTAWNIHRAKVHGDTVIVTESSFDAMRVHQAGYPNVIALLGGHVSDFHADQIAKTFSTVIIMTDFDNRIYPTDRCPACKHIQFSKREPVKCIGHRPGRDLGRSLASHLPTKRIRWAAYDDECVYPHNAKDAGDMTDDEIRTCLHNAVSNFEYSRWGMEDIDL